MGGITMMNRLNGLFLGIVVTIATGSLSANAAVIDFEEIDNTGTVTSGNSLDTQGYNISNDCALTTACILHWSSGHSFNADPGGVTYSHNYRFNTATLTSLDGGSFDLDSIDLGDVTNSGISQTFHFVAFLALGGSIVADVTTDALAGLQTFDFNWLDVTSVTWTETSGGNLQLDNIVVNKTEKAPPATPSITSLGLLTEEELPEPAPLAMIVLGGIYFGRLRYKRRITGVPDRDAGV